MSADEEKKKKRKEERKENLERRAKDKGALNATLEETLIYYLELHWIAS